MKAFTVTLWLLFANCLNAHANYKDTKTQPQKEVARHVKPIIQLLNSKDRTKIKNYLVEHFSQDWQAQLDESINYLLFLAESYGELSFHSFREYNPKLPDNEVVAILYSEHMESWTAATLIGNKAKITMLDISPAKIPSDIKPHSNISMPRAMSEINDFIERIRARSSFSGSILVAHGQDILLQKNLGESNKRYNIKNHNTTRYNLASVSKLFTGVAIGLLVDQQKLKLSDPVSKYLGGAWIDPIKAPNITIEQLLSHRSGLGNNALNHPDLQSKNKKLFKKTEDFQHFIRQESHLYQPGERMQYSNTGVFLAGVIVEKISGKRFQQFVEQHIFTALQMNHSGYFDLTLPINDVAIGYERKLNATTGWTTNTLDIIPVGTPAGGAYSNTGDMHKFLLALNNQKLMSPPTTNSIKALYKYPGHPWFNHSGLDYGVGTHFDLHESNKFIIITLSNITNGAVAVSAKIRGILERVKSKSL